MFWVNLDEEYTQLRKEISIYVKDKIEEDEENIRRVGEYWEKWYKEKETHFERYIYRRNSVGLIILCDK